MKPILLLTTGGTIASRPDVHGLAPGGLEDAIYQTLTSQYGQNAVTLESLMDLDSSNMQPEQWRVIARRVFEAAPAHAGVIITHGTDTLAYTAAALSFMLRQLPIPVVLTGSQLPITQPLTDAAINLCTAAEAVLAGVTGVTVAFDRKLIWGTRAVKVSTMGFDAFESINAGYAAQLFADGLRVERHSPPCSCGEGPFTLADTLCTDVFLLKLIPGTNPAIFETLAGMHYKGVVIEAFGAGGLHYIGRDLLGGVDLLHRAGVPVVVCSQCLYERSDLSLYEVGRHLQGRAVISGKDMTSEAAVTKLMWALGQTKDTQQVAEIFATCYAGEITL